MLRGGFDIFWAAIMAVFRDWRVALQIAVLPVLVASMVYGLDEYFWAVSFETDQDYRGLGTISLIIDVLMVGLVAHAWHRFTLLDIAPVTPFSLVSLRASVGYGVYWVLIGIFISLMLIAIVSAGVYIYDFFNRTNSFFASPAMEALVADGIFSPAVIFVLGTMFVYFLLRLSLGLPDMAVGVGRLTMMKSTRRTRAIRGQVIVLAVLVGIAQTPFLGYLAFVGDAFLYGTPEQIAFHAMIAGLLRGVVAIFGASALTELYRATGGLPVDPDEQSGGGPLERQEN